MDLKEVNKKITKAKRLWTQSKKLNIKQDSINKAENGLFVNDEKLANMVMEKEKVENEIIEYIDAKLLSNRSEKKAFTIDGAFIDKYLNNGNFSYEGSGLYWCDKLILCTYHFDVDEMNLLVSVFNWMESVGCINGELLT